MNFNRIIVTGCISLITVFAFFLADCSNNDPKHVNSNANPPPDNSGNNADAAAHVSNLGSLRNINKDLKQLTLEDLKNADNDTPDKMKLKLKRWNLIISDIKYKLDKLGPGAERYEYYQKMLEATEKEKKDYLKTITSSENPEIRNFAKKLVKQDEMDTKVLAWIEDLKSDKQSRAKNAHDHLKEITGQEFSQYSVAVWSQWWDENKDTILEKIQ